MGPEVSFDFLPINVFWTRPAFWRAEDDHWPTWSYRIVIFAGVRLNFFDSGDGLIHLSCHQLMHLLWVVTFDVIGRPAVAAEQMFKFFGLNASQNGWVTDFITIQMENWQHRTVSFGIQEFIRVPGGGQWAGLGLAITNHTCRNQARVIKGRTEGMTQRITQFATLVDRARYLR